MAAPTTTVIDWSHHASDDPARDLPEAQRPPASPTTWALPSVKSAANCAACHNGAERGVFDDDELTIPQGMDLRSRRAWND